MFFMCSIFNNKSIRKLRVINLEKKEGKNMTKDEQNVMQMIVNTLDKLTNAVAEIKKDVDKMKEENKVENLLSESEKKWAGISK